MGYNVIICTWAQSLTEGAAEHIGPHQLEFGAELASRRSYLCLLVMREELSRSTLAFAFRDQKPMWQNKFENGMAAQV
jgi:hypothetical protein